ncbi:MAG: D-alanyl-D-alanine carboxypeptidase/D-alanyl-D-alanine-endopeptidase [Thermoleophilia bacterium]
MEAVLLPERVTAPVRPRRRPGGRERRRHPHPGAGRRARVRRRARGRGPDDRRAPRVGTPDDPEAVAFLGRVASPPLTALVEEMNTDSDNFVAETLLKLLGAHVTQRGTTAAGARVVRRVLEEIEIDLDGVRIVDGSGLSRKDRLTATALASILVTAREDAELRRVFFDSLAIAGVNGTLSSRMGAAPTRGRVHAKTGTTNAASALAGYVGDRYVFAIVMNGSPVPASAARAAQDRFAALLAAD